MGVGMSNPYFISGPALISFSGGRTSAMMLRNIIDAHGGVLPDDVHVAFANTGKEHEATLRFVHECATQWNVRIRWLEFVTNLRRGGAASRFEEVGYNSASRNGEPLSRLISRKKALFSTVSGRWCTQFCKVSVLHDFMETLGYKPGTYIEAIGFRSDEYDRVYELPRLPRNAHRQLLFPLATAGVCKADVFRFWKQQPFDLELQRGTGNCDHCPFLSDKSRIARARLDPAGLDWWGDHEANRKFAFGRKSIAEIKAQIDSSPLLINDTEADAADSECGAWCAS